MNYTNLNEAWNIENFTTEENESIVKMKEVKNEKSENIVKMKEVKDDKSEIKLLSTNEQNKKLRNNVTELKKNIEDLKKKTI